MLRSMLEGQAMKTNVAQTSIDCFHSRVPEFASSQNERVMAVIKPGRDYSLCELMALTTGIDKSSMSRVVNGLRAANRLAAGPIRKCTVTGVTITPSKIYVPPTSGEQLDFGI
jgi:hypothetical protein